MTSDQKHQTDQSSAVSDKDKVQRGVELISQWLMVQWMEDTINAEEFGAEDSFPHTRETLAKLYGDFKDRGTPVDKQTGVLQIPGYPKIEFHRNGDLFGSYKDLGKYLTDTKEHGDTLRRRPGGEDIGFEVHHLLEDSFMKHFGFSTDEGLCVAVWYHDHHEVVHGKSPDTGKNEIEFKLPSGYVYHIQEVVEEHVTYYNDLGHPEWSERLLAFVREHSERIIEAYEAGKVPGATSDNIEQAKRYLRGL